jgi:tetratricopeptide (TPR) repeat protein
VSSRAATALLLSVVALLVSCRDGKERPSSGAILAIAPGGSPAGEALPSTTDGAIAMGNLDAQVRAAERLAAAQHASAGAARLVELLLLRASIGGKVADLERAAELAEASAHAAPTAPSALVLRARSRAALHRFDEALSDLVEAEKLGARPEQIASVRASCLQGKGAFDEALAMRRRAREERATTETLGAEAALLAEMGLADQAAPLFAEALRSYRDVSPFPVAWIAYQQGTMREHTGELSKAKERHAAAVRALPAFAHAAAHLALLSPLATGLQLLEPVAATADDPEYTALLWDLRALRGGPDARAGEREAALAATGKRFDELVEKHPLAFADHAARFWLGAGNDAQRALSLAARNLQARRTPAAQELYVTAALAARRPGDACRAADEALASPYPTAALRAAAKRAFAACGRLRQLRRIDRSLWW